METEIIDQFVKKIFPRLQAEDRRDLMTTAWLFLDANDIDLIDEETAVALKIHLEDYLHSGNVWRELKVGDFGARGRGNYNSGDEEKISWLAQKYHFADDARKMDKPSERVTTDFDFGADVREELENAELQFQNRRVEIQESLPPLLFEALHRAVDASVEVRWTAGFDRQSLKVFAWRALMRLKLSTFV